jgi:hypothetical protein
LVRAQHCEVLKIRLPLSRPSRLAAKGKGDGGKIDDIGSAVDGKSWSLRDLLTRYIKDVRKTTSCEPSA